MDMSVPQIIQLVEETCAFACVVDDKTSQQANVFREIHRNVFVVVVFASMHLPRKHTEHPTYSSNHQGVRFPYNNVTRCLTIIV